MDDPVDIRGWQRLNSAITTSGKLLDGDPERLAAIGVRHVINLALDDSPDALAEEAAKLAAAGIAYTHIPVPFEAPDDTHFAAFKAALNEAQGPVHVHCIMNWRVSAFFYRLHREQGMAEAEAKAQLHKLWAPELSEDPRAKVWADFIAAGGS